MKKAIFFLYLLSGVCTAYSQRPVFSTVALGHIHHREMIVFALPRESNTRYYRIEAGNDSLDMQLIATIPSKGNSVLPVQYNFELTGFAYNYYRVGKTGMDGSILWSPVVFKKKAAEMPIVPQDTLQSNEYFTAY